MRAKKLLFFLLLGVFGCSPQATDEENYLASISDTKVLQFAIPGKELYDSHCANCHQKDGKGLGKLIPPLRDADYFKSNVHRSVWIMRHGKDGEILVNGQTYNQAMPANPKLSPLEIAQISTYLYNIWGNQEGVIDAPRVEAFLREQPRAN